MATPTRYVEAQCTPEPARGKRVGYQFDFGSVWAAWPELLDGAIFTLWLSAASMVLSLIIAVFGAWGRVSGPRPLQYLIAGYVEIVRNTPFLVQIFLIFFGLPVIGIRLDANSGALIAMVLNGSAYTIEIVRAGIEAIGTGQIEAGKALGLHPFQVFRKIVLPQALRSVVPPLGSQFILLMLNSAITSVIAADDLTAAGQNIAGRTFRSFEVYLIITAIYFLLSMMFTGAFAAIERVAFGKKVAAR